MRRRTIAALLVVWAGLGATARAATLVVLNKSEATASPVSYTHLTLPTN